MLLKSSSTSRLGSLLPSISQNPNTNIHQLELHTTTTQHATSNIHHSCTSKITYTTPVSQNFIKSLMNSPSVDEFKAPQNSFRRVQSEGNLEELAHDSFDFDEFSFSSQLSKKFTRKPNLSSLEPIPSLSLHRLGTAFEDYQDSDEEEFEELEVKEETGNSFRVKNMVSEEFTKNMNDFCSLGFEGEEKLYLASGLGVSGIIDCGGHNGGGSYRPVAFNWDGGGDNCGFSIEEHYKKMMEENPGNPLFLRNYAQFLYQTKGDLPGAEEYYSRAILADPEDSEFLSQYATLIWELHHDEERATNYFQRAVQASSEDSHIHAAYASFLWDIEDDVCDVKEEENVVDNTCFGLPLIHHGIMASATA